MKALAYICGIGLGILWLVGLGTPAATPWLTWMDGVAAVFSFIVAASIDKDHPRNADIGSSALVSMGTFALWIIGMTTNGMPWQNWWTFAFACGMGIVAIACGMQRPKAYPHATVTRIDEEDRTRQRKVG